MLALLATAVHGRAASLLATPVLGVVFPDDENDDAWVTELADDGPAAKAGLRAGDTIVGFGDNTVKTVKRIRELVRKHKPGDEVKIAVRRGTKMLSFTVKLGMGQ